MLNSLSWTLACRILSEPGVVAASSGALKGLLFLPERRLGVLRDSGAVWAGIQTSLPGSFWSGVPGMLMKLFQAHAGACCSVLPHTLISWVLGLPAFLSVCRPGLGTIALRQVFVSWCFFLSGCGGCSAEVKNGTDSKERSGRSRRERSGVNSSSAIKP